jgi:hypothetical protein
MVLAIAFLLGRSFEGICACRLSHRSLDIAGLIQADIGRCSWRGP